MVGLLAYFDPGAGSLLVQALAGGAAGLLVFGKYLWDTYAAKFGWHRREELPTNVHACAAASSGEIPVVR
ncbi:MAG: hypothetical protein JSS02_14490 [Planctomycetes bacterium]|nr:hypothetical protein [Planctomycetota bacterium]